MGLNRVKDATGEIVSLERVQKFYEFLRDDLKLSPRKAFLVIYELQEEMNLIPDCFEKCKKCHCIFDTECGGCYHDETGAFLCDECGSNCRICTGDDE